MPDLSATMVRRHGDRIPALDLEIVQREPYETTREGGAVYRSAAIERLLLSDEQEWFGCTKCTAVAAMPGQIASHQKAHPAPLAMRRRQARRVVEEFTSSSRRTVETEVDEEVVAPQRYTLPNEPRRPSPRDMPARTVVGATCRNCGKAAHQGACSPAWATSTPTPAAPTAPAPEVPVSSSTAPEPDEAPDEAVETRTLMDIVRELEEARGLVLDLEAELDEAVRKDWRNR